MPAGRRTTRAGNWSATTGGHLIYESRLELARLLLADFHPAVVAIAAQPFLLRARAGGRVRRHVPDFLLIHADHTVQVVNVKPADRLAGPSVAEALAWPGELFEARGWGHEIWSGADPVVLADLRFLAGYRRPGMPPDAVTGAVLDAIGPGECVGGLLDRLERDWPRAQAKTAVLRLHALPRHGRRSDPLWRGELVLAHRGSFPGIPQRPAPGAASGGDARRLDFKLAALEQCVTCGMLIEQEYQRQRRARSGPVYELSGEDLR